jgi:hypothetical protein
MGREARREKDSAEKLNELGEANRERIRQLMGQGVGFGPEPTDIMRMGCLLEVLMGPELVAEGEWLFHPRLALLLDEAEAGLRRAKLMAPGMSPPNNHGPGR